MELKNTNYTRQNYEIDTWEILQRSGHSAIWTGKNMIIYGDKDSYYQMEIITPSKLYLYTKP